MSREKPDYYDADIVLRLYEMRREAVMRESRNAINSKFWPKSWDDVEALTKPEHPLNAPFRQVGTYWEMVYGMARNGIVNTEYLMESSGEGLLLYAKVLPYLARLREATSPYTFANAEWISQECEGGRKRLELFKARVAKALAAK